MAAEITDLPTLLPSAREFLAEWIDTQRRRTGVPGVQVAVRLGDELLFSHASGWADQPAGVELTTDHVFRIASHSKTFTATLVLRAVEAGQLRLDDTVGQWLADLADRPIGRATVRELLGHQSGVERDGLDANFWQLDQTFSDRDALIEELGHDLVFEPNVHFHYSNLGYSLLGLLLEQATGRGYHELSTELATELGAELLLGPELNVGPAAELVSGHTLPMAEPGEGPETNEAVRVIPPIDTHAEAAATGWWGNAEATTAWLSAHALGNDRLLSDASKRLMQRKESAITEGGSTRHYGLGWVITSVGERDLIGHSGGFPGHITQTWGDPATGLSVSVLTNRLGSQASVWATNLVKLVDLLLEHGEAPDEAPAVPTEQFAGRFFALWGNSRLVPLPGKVLELTAEAADPAGSASVLDVVDELTLRAEAKDGFGDAGELVRLTRDADGAITSFTSTGITRRPEQAYREQRERQLSGELLG